MHADRPELPNLWTRWKRQWRRLEKSDSVRLVKRRVRQLAGTELRHFVQLRRVTERHGGWTFVPDDLGPGSIVYSCGVGTDIAFDLALIERYGVEVEAFDPTPMAISWLASQRLPHAFHFHPLGIADYDGVATFHPPLDPKNSYTMLERPQTGSNAIAGEVHRLGTVLRTLGHTHIDLLKLDIEGAEYAVIEDLLAGGIDVRQLLVEFHHRWRDVGRARTRRAVDMLAANGYRIVAISPAGWEYSFLRVR